MRRRFDLEMDRIRVIFFFFFLVRRCFCEGLVGYIKGFTSFRGRE